VVAATGLRQTAAHHVADTQKHDEKPCPVGPEVVLMPVGGTDDEGSDEYADDCYDINDEFCCLESSFGFVTRAAGMRAG
jgi:hypothetical protein